MNIVDEILSILVYEAPPMDIRIGAFQMAVVTRHCGLASTPHDSGPHHNRAPVPEAGFLLEKDTRWLAQLANSASETEAAMV